VLSEFFLPAEIAAASIALFFSSNYNDLPSHLLITVDGYLFLQTKITHTSFKTYGVLK
jgi:hypothetical protein